MNINAMQASDISSALTMKKEVAVMASPPRNGSKARCRQP